MGVFTKVEREEVEALLTAYDAEVPVAGARGADGARAPLVVEGLAGGTVNTTYRLRRGAEACFLRLYEVKDAPGVEREAVMLARLAAGGVPTPAPYLRRDGRAGAELAGKPAVVFPWVAGRHVPQAELVPAQAAAIGRALAQVHAVGLPGEPGRFGVPELLALAPKLASSPDAAARAAAPALLARLQALADALPRDLPRGLVHGDVFRDNCLFEGETLVGLLDFESAADGALVYDLAVALVATTYGDRFEPSLAGALVAGYRAGREPTAAERAALFDACRFACVRFAITRIADRADRLGKRWQRFCERLEALEALGPRGLGELTGLAPSDAAPPPTPPTATEPGP